MTETINLFRPVGLGEMQLILEADCKAFPPRLPEQPYFYPVLNVDYANQIARDWNTKDPKSGFAGFVTEFKVDKDYTKQFEEHVVGAAIHRELWIPAEQLEIFNRHILEPIELVNAFYGDVYKGIKHYFSDTYVNEIFERLYVLFIHEMGQDLSAEITLNRNAILTDFSYWITHDYSQVVLYEGEKERFLKNLAEIWHMKFPQIRLLGVELLHK